MNLNAAGWTAIFAAAALVAAATAGAHAQPSRSLAQIDWSAAERDAAPREAFLQPVNTGFEAVSTVSVPVLLPENLDGAAVEAGGPPGCRFFARNTSYSATFEMDGALVEVTGSRLVQAVLDDLVTQPGSDGYNWTETAFGQQLSFTRYGAGYSVIVTCSEPAANPPCRDRAFVMGVARSLRVAGGRRD